MIVLNENIARNYLLTKGKKKTHQGQQDCVGVVWSDWTDNNQSTHQLSSDSPSNDAQPWVHISVASTWAPAHFETDDTRCNFPESFNPSSECYKPLCSVLAADKTVKLWDVSLQPAYQDCISLSHRHLKQHAPPLLKSRHCAIFGLLPAKTLT